MILTVKDDIRKIFSIGGVIERWDMLLRKNIFLVKVIGEKEDFSYCKEIRIGWVFKVG